MSATGDRRRAAAITVLCSGLLVATVSVSFAPAASAVAPLASGSLTMVSTQADGTAGTNPGSTAGANDVSINDDGSLVVFASPVAAEDLVTDPAQVGSVTDNNTGLDVFAYQKQPAPADPIVSLVSWNDAGTGTGDAPSTAPVAAPTGIGAVFASTATDLVAGTVADGAAHLYSWVPSLSPAVSLVDTKFSSADACNCSAEDPSISMSGPLGPTVVFEAVGGGSNDLVGPSIGNQGEQQIYAHSVVTNTNTLVSVTNNSSVPNASGNSPDVGNGAIGGASEPQIASDGSIVVFTAVGDDLVSGFDSSNGANIWTHNLATGVTTLVSADMSAAPDPNGTFGNEGPVISALGNAVAWSSNDPDVSTTTFSSGDHVFYRTLLPVASATQLVDTDSSGAAVCDDASGRPGLSGDGLSVIFDSDCDDISAVPDANSASDVFDRVMGPIPDPVPQLLSINDAGTSTGDGESLLCGPVLVAFASACASLSDPSRAVDFDGTAVTFFTGASDVAAVPNPPPPSFSSGNVVVSYPRILAGVENVNASVSVTGENPQGTSGAPVISRDGGSVVFVSNADDLVTGDANGTSDVFEADLHNTFFIENVDPVNEGAGTVTIAVERIGNNGTSDTVDVATGDGMTADIPTPPSGVSDPATQPDDYTETTHTLHFPPGTSLQTFDVPIIDDSDVENSELFHVTLTDPAGGAAIASPGSAYVVIEDNDVAPPDWSVAVTQQPTSAHVGDTVTVKATIAVDAGADDLTVNSLSSGAATSGLDNVSFADTTPFTVTAGTTKEVTATARVATAPGTAGVKLEQSVDGTLGAANSVKSADTDSITVVEAVTAALTGGPATVALTDQITYTLTLTNNSDTAAQVDVPPAGFTAPTGTTFVGRTDGSTTLASGASTSYTLTVDVDDTDANGTVLTQAPTAVTYAMSAIALVARPVALTPTSVSSTVSTTPLDTTSPDVTVEQAALQADPTSTAPVRFTVTFTEDVTGFNASDVELGASTVGGTLSATVTGGPAAYSVDVAGMTTSGSVIASVPAGAAADAASNSSNASSSFDNTVHWVHVSSPPPQPPTRVPSGVALSLSPNPAVFGQPVVATAMVTVSSGTPAGAVQFTVDGHPIGDPVPVGAGGTAMSPPLATPAGSAFRPALTPSAGPLTPGSHTIGAQFTPTDTSTYAGAAGSAALVVTKAATETALSVGPTSLDATVTAEPPGAGIPSGTVTFSVAGVVVGSAALANGDASVNYATPVGKELEVAAVYSGDADFTASSASTAPQNPTIRAHVSSAHHRTKYGWYRSTVKVSFVCITHGAPLVGGCPSPVRFSHSGLGQGLSRTISATDGGVATAVVDGINIDRTKPTVKVKGVHRDHRYQRPGPVLHCHATDNLSGVASCRLSRHSTKHDGVVTVHYRATAKDKAGNVRKAKGTFTLAPARHRTARA